MRRLENWPTRLGRTIDAAMTKEFRWGEHDCCLFACDCIEAVTGVDPAAPHRGRYQSKFGAARVLKALHGSLSDSASAVARQLSAPHIQTNAAKRGDVCFLQTEYGDALGVVYGHEIYVPAAVGLARYPVHHALKIWSV